jgi:hypothetical protein
VIGNGKLAKDYLRKLRAGLSPDKPRPRKGDKAAPEIDCGDKYALPMVWGPCGGK